MRTFSFRVPWLGLLGCGGALLGCNAFDAPADENDNGARLVIPVDERPATVSDIAPVPISGGTLEVTADGAFAVASDPDRDTISVVDLTTLALRHTITLEPGDEPGRIVEDPSGILHVALRRGGAVVDIDPGAGAVVGRRAVCKAPRGIAFEAATGLLHVACAEGRLVSLGQGETPVRTLELEADLRDVMVRGSELWVTRFKSAEVLRVTAEGALGNRVTIPESQGQLGKTETIDGNQTTQALSVNVVPEVAWRAVPTAEGEGGGAIVIHQEAVEDEIELTEPSVSGSAYGGGGGGDISCGGIVKNSVTEIGPDGVVLTRHRFSGSPLPVDVSVSPDGSSIAVAHAGVQDFGAPRPFLVFPDSSGDIAPSSGAFGGFAAGVTVLSRSSATFECDFPMTLDTTAPATAVAFAPDGRLVVQTREPAMVLVFTDVFGGVAPVAVALSAESRFDTGHDIFHRDSGGGIACASCHPEGAEDGHVWRFEDVGERRTQALHVGLRGTAPFHWNGDLDGLGALMNEVFVGRMGGVRESRERLDVLSEWVFGIEQPPAIRDAGDPAVERGRELFRSAELECSSCHAGEQFTNNETVDVGTLSDGHRLQVPSLVAIGYRAPFLHDGCASTLAGRFDASCGGGEKHGKTAHLDDTEIADLVAYLESL